MSEGFETPTLVQSPPAGPQAVSGTYRPEPVELTVPDQEVPESAQDPKAACTPGEENSRGPADLLLTRIEEGQDGWDLLASDQSAQELTRQDAFDPEQYLRQKTREREELVDEVQKPLEKIRNTSAEGEQSIQEELKLKQEKLKGKEEQIELIKQFLAAFTQMQAEKDPEKKNKLWEQLTAIVGALLNMLLTGEAPPAEKKK